MAFKKGGALDKSEKGGQPLVVQVMIDKRTLLGEVVIPEFDKRMTGKTINV